MMESFEVDCGGRRCRESFETDEFYESIEAPKFYDFTAPEEPIDPEAWFNGNPGGMTKKVTEVLLAVHNAKIQKVQAFSHRTYPESKLKTRPSEWAQTREFS
jgi:hypothetical protein